jgi:hypothetical protein
MLDIVALVASNDARARILTSVGRRAKLCLVTSPRDLAEMRHLNASTAAAAILFIAVPLAAQTSAAPSRVAITGVQAKLYFPETGGFSEDMFAERNLELWNTIIGAGWAKHPSNATLVLVEVSSSSEPGRPVFVELTVTEAGERSPKLRRRIDPSMSNTDKRQEAFWIYDTGCAPLTLRVRLVGQPSASTVQRQIPFRFGE